MNNESWFKNNPKKTVFTVVMVIFIGCDFLLGFVFIPDIEGIPHHYYHHDLKKNYHGSMRWGPMYYDLYTNSLGFKDSKNREVPLSSNKYRFLILGDSFGEGIGVPYEDTFVGLIERKLNRSTHEILNASVKSYAPKLYYLKAKFLIQEVGLHFDELYVYIDISDISDEIFWHRFEPVSRYSLPHLLKVINSYMYNHLYTYHKFGEKTFRYLVGRIYKIRRIVKNFLFVSKSDQFKEQVVFAEDGNKKEGAGPILISMENSQNDKNDVLDKDEYIDMHLFKGRFYEDRAKWTFDKKIYHKWGEKGLRLAEKHMAELVKLCNQHAKKLTIAVYPWPAQIRNKEINSVQVKFWKSFAEKHNIGFIDYFPDFISSGNSDEMIGKYFIPEDDHWNEDGHEIISEKLFDAINERISHRAINLL